MKNRVIALKMYEISMKNHSENNTLIKSIRLSIIERIKNVNFCNTVFKVPGVKTISRI